MELITYPNRPNPRADGSSVGGGFKREEIRSGCFSKDDDDHPFYCDLLRYDLSVWVDKLDDFTEDVPELPPANIVHHRDLLEKGWGCQRLVLYAPGNVDWTIFKEYLKEYCIQNAGEIAALCANKKSEKDKAYFCALYARKMRNNKVKGNRGRNAGVAAPRCAVKKSDIHGKGIASPTILRVAAHMCIEVENDFCWGVLTDEDISLSHQIVERAKHVIQSAGEEPVAAAALVCIAKEIELLFDLLECDDFDTTEMITFSKKVRLLALNLMLYDGPESAAAACAMVGMAEEAKFMRYTLSRLDSHMYLDYFLCDIIRKDTAIVLTTLLKESGFAVPEECSKAQDPVCEKVEMIVGETECKDQGWGEMVDETECKVLQLGKMADEAEWKNQQLGKVTALANSGLARLNRGEKLSQEEMKEYLLNFLRLATEQVVNLEG